MQEIWSLLPDLKGNGSELDNRTVEMFNNSEKSWWYCCQAWRILMGEYKGGDLLLLNTVIGEAQEEILGMFANAILDMTEKPCDPFHYEMEVSSTAKDLVPLMLVIFGDDRYARIIRMAEDSQQPILQKWAQEATVIDWSSLDA